MAVNNYQPLIKSGLENTAKQLIWDRTQADVDYALMQERDNIYSEENLRGAYNISDRNRVGAAVNYLNECLRNTGTYHTCGNIRENRDMLDIIGNSDNREVLASLAHLRRLLPYGGTEEVPNSLDGLTYGKANTVEHILFDLCGVLMRLWDSWLYSGDGYASDFDAFNWQGWDA